MQNSAHTKGNKKITKEEEAENVQDSFTKTKCEMKFDMPDKIQQ